MNHELQIVWVTNNHGYPYRAECSCGWKSNTYVSKNAAQMMGDDHTSPAVYEPIRMNG